MRRAAAALAASGITALCAFGLTSGVAGADAPDVQGWWTVSNPGSPVPTPPAPPDVPPNGLVVEGGPNASSPASYAGLLYDLPSGALPASLTLQVAPNSGTTPDTALEICPLKSPSLQAEQGGPMSDAPAYDCTTHVTAKPTSSGNSYRFALATLTITNQTMAVAVLPTTSTDRVVFSAPGPTSLAVAAPGKGGSTELSGPGATANQGTASSAATGGSAGTGSAGSANPPSLSLPTTGSTSSAPSNTAPVVAPSAGAAPAAAPAAMPVADMSSGAANRRVVVVVLVAAVAGAIAWTGAGNAAVRAAARGLTPPATGGHQQGSA